MGRHPVLARADEAGDRFYSWKGETFWSVTTLISGGVPKYHLPPWYAKTVAERAYRDLEATGPYAGAHPALRRWARAGRRWILDRQLLGELTSIDAARETDVDLALRWLKAAPVEIRDAAAAVGTDVHAEADELVKRLALDSLEAYAGGAILAALPPWPDELAGYQRAFVTFLAEWRPIYLAAEATVFNRTQAFGGTLDAIVDIEYPAPARTIGVLDIKSGNQVYAEVGMQLAAYARGEFIASPDRLEELPLPPVDLATGFALHLRPTGKYSLRPIRIDDAVYAAFLHAREGYRWGKQTSKTILGAPLVAPVRTAA